MSEDMRCITFALGKGRLANKTLDSLEKISTNAKARQLWAIKNIHIDGGMCMHLSRQPNIIKHLEKMEDFYGKETVPLFVGAFFMLFFPLRLRLSRLWELLEKSDPE